MASGFALGGAEAGPGTPPAVWTSNGGTKWRLAVRGHGQGTMLVVAAGRGAVAEDSGPAAGNDLWTSTDGKTWTAAGQVPGPDNNVANLVGDAQGAIMETTPPPTPLGGGRYGEPESFVEDLHLWFSNGGPWVPLRSIGAPSRFDTVTGLSAGGPLAVAFTENAGYSPVTEAWRLTVVG